MTEEEARAWLRHELDVPRETLARLEAFVSLLKDENRRQNLVSKTSLDHIWARHLVDSAQLLRFSPSPKSSWLDLGTGAGFPGLIVAALHNGPVTLVEERRRRVDFLRQAADCLAVQPEILGTRLERVPRRRFEVISARAFASLPKLLELATGFSTTKTVWLLPKGRNAASELAALDSSWQGDFRLEPSLTDDTAAIIVASNVRQAMGKRG